jgi:hypothetical protein
MGELLRALGDLKLHAAAGLSPGMNGRGRPFPHERGRRERSHMSGLSTATVLEFPQF